MTVVLPVDTGSAGPIREAWWKFTGKTDLLEVNRSLRQVEASYAHLQESYSDLERRMIEPGWVSATQHAHYEFSRPGLQQITAVCRLMSVKNPLIKRGLTLRAAYIWGQGVSISARSAGGDGGEQDVNTVVQDFLDDESNRRTFTSPQARVANERALGTDGNLHFALFTSPRTGRVQVRVLPWDEMLDVIANPEDSTEPWYYERRWHTPEGAVRSAYYPALGYRPPNRPKQVRNLTGFTAEVLWDAPVLHAKVNDLLGWKHGVGDAYAAIDWANAYREFLTDWATLVKALSRFAWRMTAKGQKQAAARAKIAAAPSRSPVTGELMAAGGTAILSPDMDLEAIPKTGATIDSESGRPLAMMVAAAFGIPVTMLLGDPGQTGARATAETLDQPTELEMQGRRMMWADIHRRILGHVIDQAVKAPQGPLKGKVSRDADGREEIILDGDTDDTIDITFPDLSDADVAGTVNAIAQADATGRMPALVVARLLMEALGVEDVDEWLEKLTDDDGNFLDPAATVGATVGQAAADAFRRGADPSAAIGADPAPPAAPPAQGPPDPTAT